jgi:uncharacterized Zn-binding protein involved in type VI secretion
MANLPIAVIGDSVSTHYANNTPPYFVTQTRIIGAPGPAAARGAKGFFSGSLDVFADSRPVHRVSDIVGQPHFSNATPADIPPSGGYVPCETIATLGFAAVYNFHHQSYLAEGSPTVFVNGKSVGHQGAIYVCSASVTERGDKSEPTVFVPNST